MTDDQTERLRAWAAAASPNWTLPLSRSEVEAIVAAMDQRAELLERLKVTAGNIRSLGPAGALNDSYRPWLAAVEAAIAKAEAR